MHNLARTQKQNNILKSSGRRHGSAAASPRNAAIKQKEAQQLAASATQSTKVLADDVPVADINAVNDVNLEYGSKELRDNDSDDDLVRGDRSAERLKLELKPN